MVVAFELNKVTISDVILLLFVDQFSEKFASFAFAPLINFIFRYDQIDLDDKFRDLTKFITPVQLMRMTALPQGVTNLVTHFVRIVKKILADYFRDQVEQLLDNLGVKNLKINKNNMGKSSEIR